LILRTVSRIGEFLSVIPKLAPFPKLRGPVPLIVVDRTGSDIVAELIPNPVPFWVLPVRDESRYVSLRSFRFFLTHLPLVFKKRINMLGLYVLSAAHHTGAKVLITWIDNCSWDKGLHQVSDIRIITIQNGLRTINALTQKEYDVFLGFSTRDTEVVRTHANQSISIGSVRMGLAYQNRNLKRGHGEANLDLLFISQFRPEFWHSSLEEDRNHVTAIKTTMEWIRNLAEEDQLTVGIAFSSKGPDADKWYREERDIFRALLKMEFSEYHRERFSERGIDDSYGGLFDAKTVVAISSTLCFETIGLGKPLVMTTLLFEDDQSEHFSWFPKTEFRDFMVQPNYNAFTHAVRRGLSGTEMVAPSSTLGRYHFCAFDLESPPQKQATEVIVSLIKS